MNLPQLAINLMAEQIEVLKLHLKDAKEKIKKLEYSLSAYKDIAEDYAAKSLGNVSLDEFAKIADENATQKAELRMAQVTIENFIKANRTLEESERVARDTMIYWKGLAESRGAQLEGATRLINSINYNQLNSNKL